MDGILRTTPSYEQLIEELDNLRKKVILLEKDPSESDNQKKRVELNDYPTLIKLASGADNLHSQKELDELQQKYLAEIAEIKEQLNNASCENKYLKREIHKQNEAFQESEKKVLKYKSRSERLVKINKVLKGSNADLENFIYSASHDLRSPISNLEGLINILKIELGDKIQQSEVTLLKMIATSISRFKQTIFDLTEITTFQKQEAEAYEPVNLEEILEDVRINIHNKIEEAGAVIETDFKVPEIKFARKNLRSILFNLLINAVKYRSPRRPLKIKLSSRTKGKFIIFEIEDNGLGFLPEQKEKLFQMFKRIHTHVEGTGVGLYIVKKIVENSGGKIEVESELNKGSKFKIFFKL